MNTIEKESKKDSFWDVSWKKDNWQFGNPISIQDFDKMSDPFLPKNEKEKEK
jgi:hypothetical protein